MIVQYVDDYQHDWILRSDDHDGDFDHLRAIIPLLFSFPSLIKSFKKRPACLLSDSSS
jgi:hypothetical protein